MSYVLRHQPKSFDWRLRRAKPHPLKKLADVPFQQVREVLIQVVTIA